MATLQDKRRKQPARLPMNTQLPALTAPPLFGAPATTPMNAQMPPMTHPPTFGTPVAPVAQPAPYRPDNLKYAVGVEMGGAPSGNPLAGNIADTERGYDEEQEIARLKQAYLQALEAAKPRTPMAPSDASSMSMPELAPLPSPSISDRFGQAAVGLGGVLHDIRDKVFPQQSSLPPVAQARPGIPAAPQPVTPQAPVAQPPMQQPGGASSAAQPVQSVAAMRDLASVFNQPPSRPQQGSAPVAPQQPYPSPEQSGPYGGLSREEAIASQDRYRTIRSNEEAREAADTAAAKQSQWNEWAAENIPGYALSQFDPQNINTQQSQTDYNIIKGMGWQDTMPDEMRTVPAPSASPEEELQYYQNLLQEGTGSPAGQSKYDAVRGGAGRRLTLSDENDYGAKRGLPSMYGAREAMGVPSPTTVNDDGSHNVAKHMGPNVGGLPGYSQFEASKEAEAQKKIDDNRDRYVDFMNKRSNAGGEPYTQYWNPETGQKDLPPPKTLNDSSGAAYARNQKDKNGLTPYQRRIARQTENFDAGRAANYGRSRGLPPAVATAGIQGLDKRKADPNYEPSTDIERRGMGMPPMNDSATLAENRTLHASAIGQYLAQGGDPAGLPAVIGGLESAYPTRSNTGNAGPPTTPDPNRQPRQNSLSRAELERWHLDRGASPEEAAELAEQGGIQTPWYEREGVQRAAPYIAGAGQWASDMYGIMTGDDEYLYPSDPASIPDNVLRRIARSPDKVEQLRQRAERGDAKAIKMLASLEPYLEFSP